jgi:hypothetical protein
MPDVIQTGIVAIHDICETSGLQRSTSFHCKPERTGKPVSVEKSDELF